VCLIPEVGLGLERKGSVGAEQDREVPDDLAYLVIEAHPALLHHPVEPRAPVLEGAARRDPMPRHDLAKELHEVVAASRAHALA